MAGAEKNNQKTFKNSTSGKVGIEWYKDPLLEVLPGRAHFATEVAPARFLRWPGLKKRPKNILRGGSKATS